MSLTEEEKREFKRAVRAWADKHPRGDLPEFQLGGGGEYSAKQIADEIEQETDFGRLELRVVELALEKGHTFKDVIEGYSDGRKQENGERL